MRRKKNEVTVAEAFDEQGVTLEPKHHAAPVRQTGPTKAQVAAATPSIPVAQADGDDGLIDLDPERPTAVPPATANEVAQPKQKRKYTRRKKANSGATFTPTFVDLDAIRAARIQAFTAYVDGKDEFDRAAALDDQLKKLHDLGKEIATRQIKA